MLKQWKGFTVGVLTGALLLTSVSAFADPVQKQITAVYNNVKLVVNGQR